MITSTLSLHPLSQPSGTTPVASVLTSWGSRQDQTRHIVAKTRLVSLLSRGYMLSTKLVRGGGGGWLLRRPNMMHLNALTYSGLWHNVEDL